MKLIHGDCLEKMKDIPDNSVDMILADLPYGTTACSWDIVIPFEPLWVQYKRMIKKKGAIVLFGSEPFSSLLRVSNLDWYKYDWVWEKTRNSNPYLAAFQPLRVIENIIIFYNVNCLYNPQMLNGVGYQINRFSGGRIANNIKSKGTGITSDIIFHRYPTNIIKIPNKSIEVGYHPTQKPIALLEYLIKTYTQEGDLVLDNCMGSGSTGIACLNTKRDFIGIELYPLPNQPVSQKNPDYFGIAKNRIAKWQFEPSENSKEEQINLF